MSSLEGLKRQNKILRQENGKLRSKIIYYADRYEFLGGKTLLQEVNMWKKKFENLNKEIAGTGKGMCYKKKYQEAEAELAYYKSKFIDYEYKYKEEIRNNLVLKNDIDKLKIQKSKMSSDLFKLMSNIKNAKIQHAILNDKIKQMIITPPQQPHDNIKGWVDPWEDDKVLEAMCKNSSADSYGYNSMDACIEDMISDNPEYPFTDKEKDKILNDAMKLVDKNMDKKNWRKIMRN
jgi:hypothetical protein